jgi:Family of unknown function (DUF5682)
MNEPVIFGVRHLSPAGSWHLLQLLNDLMPDIVLIEGPSDLTDQLAHLCAKNTKPPIAIMAYSETVPIRTILYPFAVYSPEYQGIKWAQEHKRACRFIDLPSSVFLAIQESRIQHIQADQATAESADQADELPVNVYQRIADLANEDSQETFWERHFEHNQSTGSYQLASAAYGSELRGWKDGDRLDEAENTLREAYMKYQIELAIAEGYAPEKIVVVTGAYHVAGIKNTVALSQEELAGLPAIPAQSTLMPYSYYRLSSRSGYGAGNKAPAYYELLWNSLNAESLEDTAYAYLSRIAKYQRQNGHMVSSASVIEAVRLSFALAGMKGFATPSLKDLRDSAVTCMGHGNFSEIALAVADTEIGTMLGSLPEGISRTSIQADFYRLMKELKLEKYKSTVAMTLELDLRENTRVKSEQAAFIDLNRSFFLHRLLMLGISFAKKQATTQSKATWAENWNLQWSVEAEIELVESVLKGETVELATAFEFKERIEESTSIAVTAKIIEDACMCGMPQSVQAATQALQNLAIDAASIKEIADTAYSLSVVIRYGTIRKFDDQSLIPILQQLFLRGCLIMVDNCSCDNKAVNDIITAMNLLNEVSINHDFLDSEGWIKLLMELSNRDNINTKASGFATAILLERGLIDNQLLATQVERRLSKGIPADLGASWFEGLALKNKYALIARLSLWEKLSEYLDTLDDEEFKRALVFLRRAFSNFQAKERSDIAENLGEIWGLNVQQVSDVLNRETTEQEQQMLSELGDFDFDDL